MPHLKEIRLLSNGTEHGWVSITVVPSRAVCENPSSLINTEKILNRPITKFYNSDNVTVIVAELRLTKKRPTSFYKKHNLL